MRSPPLRTGLISHTLQLQRVSFVTPVTLHALEALVAKDMQQNAQQHDIHCQPQAELMKAHLYIDRSNLNSVAITCPQHGTHMYLHMRHMCLWKTLAAELWTIDGGMN